MKRLLTVVLFLTLACPFLGAQQQQQQQQQESPAYLDSYIEMARSAPP